MIVSLDALALGLEGLAIVVVQHLLPEIVGKPLHLSAVTASPELIPAYLAFYIGFFLR